MWKYLRRLAIIPLLGLFGLMPNEAEASHLMGVDLTYQCINNCTIRVHLRAYRDCDGASGITNNVTFTPVSGSCPAPTPITPWSAQVTTEVTPICNTIQTKCSNPSAVINGVEEYYWFRDYDICSSSPCTFTMSWSTCCRNPAITTITSPSSASMYIGSTTLNTAITPCNNSPTFTTPPVPYICNGQPFTFNQGAFDPEGDSLSYSLGPCYSTSTTPVTYTGGASPTQPLGSTWTVSINPVTGDITILPTPGSVQVGVMCVYVTEWRNGVQLNTIVRDIQITVIPCPGNVVPGCPGITGVSGGIRDSNYTVTVCAGTQLDFDMPITDPDVGDIHTVYWNSNLAGAGAVFYQTSNPLVVDTVTGPTPTVHFQWTPTTLGTYTFLLTVQDDACPILGTNQYTITINVIGGLLGASANATLAGCTQVNFTSSPGTSGTGPFTYQWSGDGNINVNPSNNQQNFTHTFPSPGTYNYQCIITDSFGCQAIIDTVINVPTGPTADAGPDISVCSGFPVQLGAAPMPGHSYQWTPATGLNNTTISNPTLLYTNTSSTPDTLQFVLVATQGLCVAPDYVTVVVYPTPSASISGNLNICEGSSTTLTASGGTSYVWSTGDTTASITVSPLTTTTYTVTAIGNGCSSQPAVATVQVSRGPNAIVTGPGSVCPGDNATLTVVGGTSWLWSTGETTQTITLTSVYMPTTVTVVPSQGGCPGAAVSYTVTMNDKPTADFNNTTVCEGDQTVFNDNSTVATGGIIDWIWNFGDVNSGANNFSTLRNPRHIYTAAGTYNTQLIVTSSNGCKDTIAKAVIVNPLPETDFTFDDVCEGETMQFNDITPGAVASWAWNFNDGTTSNQQNPSHTYANPGAYNVVLNVTDQNGCFQSKTRTVFVHPKAEPGFTYDNSCFNTVTTFTSTSVLNDPYGTEIGAHQWNFGDPASGAANTSGAINPVHNYPGPGNYSVTLTIITTKGCEETIIKNITVGDIPPLEINPDTICRGYSAFLSVGNIPQGVAIEWYYTKNGSAGQPFHIGRNYTTPPLDQTVTYWVGMYNPADGCRSARVPIWVKVWSPPQLQMDVQRELEIPNAVAEFTVTGIVTSSSIVSYNWTFGDGSGSDVQNPVHQYTDEGTYTVTLTIVDENGCETFYEFKNWIEVTQNIRLYIPNAFTPNGDGINDEFFIGTRLITDIQISVFDRWGKMVFESEDPNFRWAGKDGGEDLPEGVYAYKINATSYDGEKFSKSGSITLIR